MFIYLFRYACICPSIRPFIHPSVNPSIRHSIHLSASPAIAQASVQQVSTLTLRAHTRVLCTVGGGRDCQPATRRAAQRRAHRGAAKAPPLQRAVSSNTGEWPMGCVCVCVCVCVAGREKQHH
eukprot:359432-Chlamydomonas_euryale.AAC.3